MYYLDTIQSCEHIVNKQIFNNSRYGSVTSIEIQISHGQKQNVIKPMITYKIPSGQMYLQCISTLFLSKFLDTKTLRILNFSSTFSFKGQAKITALWSLHHFNVAHNSETVRDKEVDRSHWGGEQTCVGTTCGALVRLEKCLAETFYQNYLNSA